MWTAPRKELARRWNAGIVLLLGRFGVVLAAAAVSLDAGPTAILLVASVFFVCLQRSFNAIHVSLGAAAAAVTAAILGLVATMPVALWLPSVGLGSLALAGTALGICLVVPPVEHVLRTRVLGRGRVLVIGPAGSTGLLLDELVGSRRLPLEIVGVPDGGEPTDVTPAEGVDLHRPDVFVLSPGRDDSRGLAAETIELHVFFEQVLGRVPPRQVTPEWLANLPPPSRRSRWSKRAFDVAVASVALVLTAPLWAIVALVAVTTPGGPLLKQLRVGEGGTLFGMHKLRTMRRNAEPQGKALWAQAQDPRVTFAGQFLRTTHLDELPQLWNVLKGDMSIVGPRPERPELVAVLEEAIPHWTCRHLVKPGITGWAQVRHGYAADCDGSERKLSYDLWYLRHQTLLLDLAICVRTIPSLVPPLGRVLRLARDVNRRARRGRGRS